MLQEIHRTSTKMRSEKDVEFALHLPVLAIVPAIQPLGTTRKQKPSQTGMLTGGNLSEGARA